MPASHPQPVSLTPPWAIAAPVPQPSWIAMPVRLLLFAVAALASLTTALAQNPQAVRLDGAALAAPQKWDAREAFQPCGDSDAGTVSIGALTGQSTDFSLDTIFLCFGDEVVVDHNGDQRLDGDPDASTPAGVGYAWYECRPTAEGPTRIAVEADRCLIDNPNPDPAVAGFYLSTGGRLDGDQVFRNDGSVQAQFGGLVGDAAGDPTLIWFAPATFDALEDGAPTYEGGGACVSVSTRAAFAVVYLNEVAAGGLTVSDCGGAFTLRGGLPEYDDRARYDVRVVNDADASVVGEVLNPDVAHGGELRFRVPSAGTYRVLVADAKGCAEEVFTAEVSACTPRPEVRVAVDTARGAPGSTVCLAVRAVDGWTDLLDYDFDLAYELPLLRYDGVQNLHPQLFDFQLSASGGRLLARRNVTTGGPSTIPAGAILFEVCFELLGDEGELAPVRVLPPAGGGFGFEDGGGALTPRFTDGGILISAEAFGVFAEALPGCGGEDANALRVMAFGGTPPYSIRFGPVGPGTLEGPFTLPADHVFGTSASDLSPGDYFIEVVDAANVPSTYVLAVSDGPTLTVNIDVVSALRCRGDVTGALRAVPLLDFSPGGRPEDYTYDWTLGGASFANAPAVSELAVGSYALSIADARGCTASNTVTVTSPAPITPNARVRDATCTGPADGEIELRPSGGTASTGDYDYVVTRPDGSVENRRGPGLLLTGDPGAYAIEVRDENGCRQNAPQTVGVVREIGLGVVIDSISCFEADDATVLVIGREDFGGPAEAPFAFNWSGAARGGTNNTNTTSEITGLAPGTYVLLATDAFGCEARDTFALAEPELLVATVAGVGDETCFPGEDGFAEVSVTGGTRGTPAYTYAWTASDGSAAGDSARVAGLTAGAYRVLVTDARGCTDTLDAPVEIGAPTPPEIVALEDFRVRCFGESDGVLEVEAVATENAIAGVTWSHGAAGARVSGLAAGTYVATVTDVAGCTTIDTAEVTEPGALAVADTVLVDPICFQQGGGSIQVTMAGGTAPFRYEWSDGTAGVGADAISGDAITAGSYVVTVTDANDCPSVTEVYTLGDAPGIDPTFRDFGRASCAVIVCDGRVTVDAALPGRPGATFDFTWDSGERTGDATASTAVRLCGGRNAVFIQESSGLCPPQEFPVDIPAPDPIVVATDTTDVRCFGERSGRIDVTEAFGGIPGYTYRWTTPAGQQTGPSAIDVPAGPTYLELRDEDNCPYLDTFRLREPELLTLTEDSARTVDPLCYGFADGEIYLAVSGGNTGAKNLRWDDEPTRDRTEATGLPAGVYTAQATDVKGCVAEVEVTLTEPDAITYAFLPYDSIRCFGEFTFVELDSVAGGTGQLPADYQVSVNGSSFSPIDQRFQVPGARVLSVRVVDPEGCEANGELVIDEPPAITARLATELTIQLGDSVRLRPSLIAGGAPLRFDALRWTPDSTLSMGGEDGRVNPYAKPLETTTYTLAVEDEDGCAAEASVRVVVKRNRDVYIPTAFSPNNDAVNDQLQVFTGPGVAAIESVSVYNRWGELVHEATDLPIGGFGQTVAWSGEFKGELVDAGVYVFMAKVRFLDGRDITYKGNVTVVY